MTEPRDAMLRLRDGRALGWREQGDPHGPLVFFLHGLRGSRLEHPPDPGMAARVGVRLVTLDRPGRGGSDPSPDARIVDWPRDLEALADHLGVARFAVAAWAGGTPFALACVHALPHRVHAVLVAAPSAPPAARSRAQRLAGSLAAATAPFARAAWRRREVRHAADPDAWLDATAARLAAPDREILARPDVRAMLRASAAEAFRQGPDAVVREAWQTRRSWGFSLHELRVPVHVWYGEHDRATPPDQAMWLASVLPKAWPQSFPAEGHLLAFAHWGELLATVAREKAAD